MKKTSGLVPGAHGSPWTAISALEDRCDVLLENIIELSGRVTEILNYVQNLEARLEALKKPVPKKKAASAE